MSKYLLISLVFVGILLFEHKPGASVAILILAILLSCSEIVSVFVIVGSVVIATSSVCVVALVEFCAIKPTLSKLFADGHLLPTEAFVKLIQTLTRKIRIITRLKIPDLAFVDMNLLACVADCVCGCGNDTTANWSEVCCDKSIVFLFVLLQFLEWFCVCLLQFSCCSLLQVSLLWTTELTEQSLAN